MPESNNKSADGTGNVTCTRRFQFCAGHRVFGHENKCSNLHGHNYVAYVTCQAQLSPDAVDSIGRVIDFSVIKERIGQWIDYAWDHGFIIHEKDSAARKVLELMSELMLQENKTQKIYYLPYNPTAENMARYLVEQMSQALLAGTNVDMIGCVIQETENCSAEFTR